jgi:glutathione synthase/RimK-type ligase-like ATP-grasp enzyme
MNPNLVTILTDRRYVNPKQQDPYVRNILNEDGLVAGALEKKGLRVERRSWDDPDYDWSDPVYILFRSTWDYFDRFTEFSRWLEDVKERTRMLNPYEVVRWNLDKHYLKDLTEAGIRIPPTRFIEQGDKRTLTSIVMESGWSEVILKPVVSGAARHTYRFLPEEVGKYEQLFQRLLKDESLMIQEFQQQVPVRGEVAFMVIGGKFTHAILKKAKEGDFRVQDDYGGTVQSYQPEVAEIVFAETVVEKSGFRPVYARVDAIWDNQDHLAVSELELIEPEMWFRFLPEAADLLAETILRECFEGKIGK